MIGEQEGSYEEGGGRMTHQEGRGKSGGEKAGLGRGKNKERERSGTHGKGEIGASGKRRRSKGKSQ